ncbi:hypothetical protein KIN20_003770, partial [Parelaphostrongylus tenuis]
MLQYAKACTVTANLHRSANNRHNRSPATTSFKPAIFIDAGIHAREWISSAAALYIIKK